MKTTIDIPDNMLNDLMSNTKAHTKREAVLTAIDDYNRKIKITRLADVIGTFDEFITSDELDASRGSS